MDFDYYLRLTENPDLMRAVIAFNGLEQAPEDLSPPPGSSAGSMASTTAIRSSLRSFFSRTTAKGFWDFENEANRLALVDPESFHRACLLWGAAFFAPCLAQVIARAEVATLKNGLGPEVYRFALGRGRFYLGSLREGHSHASAGNKTRLSRDIVKGAGLEAAAVCAGNWPDDLRARAESKFKVALHVRKDRSPLWERPDSVWFWFKKILLEAAPQWQPCFV